LQQHFCLLRLGQQYRKGRNVVVALNQRRQRAGSFQREAVKIPDRLGNRCAVAVDEQRGTSGIDVLREAGQMDLGSRRQWQRRDEGLRVAAVVGAGHIDVVDVEQPVRLTTSPMKSVSAKVDAANST